MTLKGTLPMLRCCQVSSTYGCMAPLNTRLGLKRSGDTYVREGSQSHTRALPSNVLQAHMFAQ